MRLSQGWAYIWKFLINVTCMNQCLSLKPMGEDQISSYEGN